jgi:hypothetical protein
MQARQRRECLPVRAQAPAPASVQAKVRNISRICAAVGTWNHVYFQGKPRFLWLMTGKGAHMQKPVRNYIADISLLE